MFGPTVAVAPFVQHKHRFNICDQHLYTPKLLQLINSSGMDFQSAMETFAEAWVAANAGAAQVSQTILFCFSIICS